MDVDARKKIFAQVFLNILKFKTRILITNSLDLLNQSDRILVMKDGRIQMTGTYSELQSDPEFLEVL